MDALTTRRLGALAKLYRAGIGGADAELAVLIDERADELPALLGFPRENLPRLREHHDPVDVLVRTIEDASQRSRDAGNTARREAARALAVDLARASTLGGDGTVVLDPKGLDDVLARWPGNGVLAFDERGGVGIGRLRAILRACRRVATLRIEVTGECVCLTYTVHGARGSIRLALHDVSRLTEVVVVPIDAVTRHALKSVEPRPAPIVVAPPTAPAAIELEKNPPTEVPAPIVAATEPAVAATRRPERVSSRPLAWRFLDAITAALGGS